MDPSFVTVPERSKQLSLTVQLLEGMVEEANAVLGVDSVKIDGSGLSLSFQLASVEYDRDSERRTHLSP